MNLHLHDVRLRDRELWACAREAIPEHRAVLVELSSGGCSGWGEAAQYLPGRYNSSIAVTRRRLGELRARLRVCDLGEVPELARQELADAPFARAALDCAAHDLAARLAGVPLYAHLRLPSPEGRRSSFSIGLADPGVMVAKLRRTPGWHQYKIKLARPDDLQVLAQLREHTAAPFWVDGNAAWQPEQLLPVLDAMSRLGVVALEQPYPVAAVAAQRALRAVSPMPVFADESVSAEADLEPAGELFHGVNVKVLEAGGLAPAVRMLRRARVLGLRTMLGCVPESSAGASVAAHLGGLADHLDLDTVALLAADPGTGIRLDASGSLHLAPGTGSGFEPDPSSPCWWERRVGGKPSRRIA